MGVSGETKNGSQWRDQEWVSLERPRMGVSGETKKKKKLWRDQEWVSVERHQEWVSVERLRMGHYRETINGCQWRD